MASELVDAFFYLGTFSLKLIEIDIPNVVQVVVENRLDRAQVEILSKFLVLLGLVVAETALVFFLAL